MVNVHRFAQCAQNILRVAQLLWRDLFGGRPDGDALADLAGRIGHRAHDGLVPQTSAEFLDRHTGYDGQHQCIRCDQTVNQGQHLIHHLGLDREDYDVAALDRFRVISCPRHLITFSQRHATFRARASRYDMLRFDQFFAEQAFDHGFRHDAAPHNGDAFLSEHEYPTGRYGSGEWSIAWLRPLPKPDSLLPAGAEYIAQQSPEIVSLPHVRTQNTHVERRRAKSKMPFHSPKFASLIRGK